MQKEKKLPKNVKLIEERGRGEKSSGRGLVPASSHGVLDHPFNAYLDELDIRGNSKRTQEAHFALAIAKDMRFQQFLKCLSEPRFKRLALATVAKYCDISLPQFHQFWQDSQKNIALARAQNAIPDLVSDLVTDAATKLVSCPKCDGFGTIQDQSAMDDAATGADADADDSTDNSKLEGTVPVRIRPCPSCKGKGEVREVGNQHARDRILEIGGMIKKDRGQGVQITQNFGGMTMESAVDSLNKITFDVIDVEPE